MNIPHYAIFNFDFEKEESLSLEVNLGVVRVICRNSAFDAMQSLRAPHLSKTFNGKCDFTAESMRDGLVEECFNAFFASQKIPKSILFKGMALNKDLFLPFLNNGQRNAINNKYALRMAAKNEAGEIVKLKFDQFPNPSHYLSAEINGKGIVITANDMENDPISAISKLAKFINPNCSESSTLTISDGPENRYLMHVCPKGNDIHFTSNGNETSYWVCDEFKLGDIDESAEVLGAVCGAIVKQGK